MNRRPGVKRRIGAATSNYKKRLRILNAKNKLARNARFAQSRAISVPQVLVSDDISGLSLVSAEEIAMHDGVNALASRLTIPYSTFILNILSDIAVLGSQYRDQVISVLGNINGVVNILKSSGHCKLFAAIISSEPPPSFQLIIACFDAIPPDALRSSPYFFQILASACNPQ